MPYEIHPTQESIVCTPDGGVIECKHEAAANRVRDELNARDALIMESTRFFSHHEFCGDKLRWLKSAGLIGRVID